MIIWQLVLLVSIFLLSFTSGDEGSHLKPDDTSRSSHFGPIATLPFEPIYECTSLLVMLHGLGDRGDSKSGWLGTMGSYQMSRPGACVILPTARKMFVKVARRSTTAWFDVSDARFRDLKQEVDVEEVQASAEYILRITKTMMKRFDLKWNRVIFAGFSQGAAMALYLGLTAPETPAGIVSIGGFLAAQSYLLGLGVMGRLRSDVHILLIHGQSDKVVPQEHALYALDSLKKAGVKNVLLETDPEMQHGLNDAMFKVMLEFVDKRLATTKNEDL